MTGRLMSSNNDTGDDWKKLRMWPCLLILLVVIAGLMAASKFLPVREYMGRFLEWV